MPLEFTPVFVDGGVAIGEVGPRSSRSPRRKALDHGRLGAGDAALGSAALRTVDDEHLDDLVEFAGLALGLFDGGIGLFDQGRVVLRSEMPPPMRRAVPPPATMRSAEDGTLLVWLTQPSTASTCASAHSETPAIAAAVSNGTPATIKILVRIFKFDGRTNCSASFWSRGNSRFASV
jgi:hypothetical protein